MRRRDGWLIATALFLVLACVSDWTLSQRKLRPSSQFVPPSGQNFDPKNEARGGAHTQPFGRVVYPYSVIPGGVQSVQELKNAVAKDPVVAAHFASFHLERAWVLQLDRKRSMHVSYRLGERIYWTKRKLTLRKGETVITDGVRTARTRCGNLVAVSIDGPVFPTEPTAEKLNTPESRLPPLATPDIPATANPPTGSSGGGITPVGFVPGVPTVPTPFPQPQPPPNPVVNVPEPGTGFLLLAALLSIALALALKPFLASKRLK